MLDGDTRYVSPHLTKDANVPLRQGTILQQKTPGGGGYGDPLDRDVAAVRADVRNEYVSLQNARELYGVVITDDGQVDEEATTELRRAIRRSME